MKMNNNRKNKQVIHLHNYNPPPNETIIIDTNVMLTIFTPYRRTKQREYTALWSRIKKSGAKVIVSSVQISEFINRCIRIEFDFYKSNNNLDNIDYKKDYRSTQDYREKMEDILNIIIEDIVPNFDFVDDKFAEMKHEEIFRKGFSYDFNDALMVELTKKYDSTLITDDGDFANYELDFPVVTSNSLLLMMRY